MLDARWNTGTAMLMMLRWSTVTSVESRGAISACSSISGDMTALATVKAALACASPSSTRLRS